MEHLIVQYFSVKFHFLNNDKGYNRDFFTTDTTDDGLPFHSIKSILPFDNICLVVYTIFGKSVPNDKASWSHQGDRLTQKLFHLEEHIKLRRIAFSKGCDLEL